MTHAPATQTRMPMQLLPHMLQWSASVSVSVQPSAQHVGVSPPHAAPPPTLPMSPLHTHRPPMHISPAPQLTPQPPQLFSSVAVSTQPSPAQHVSPAPQAAPPSQRQAEPMQVSPLSQVTPQPPQLLASVAVLTQPPGQQLSMPEQAGPPAQRHEVPLQVSPVSQVTPQPPQLVTVFKATQLAPQQRWPLTHAGPVGRVVPPQAQSPAALHDSFMPQVVPHAPQFEVEKATSQ